MNQTTALKISGLFLLCLGVAFCAAFGARQSPEMFNHIENEGGAKASESAFKAAQENYNKLRKNAELVFLEDVTPPLPTFKIPTSAPQETVPKLIQDHIRQLSSRVGPHDGMLETARQTWLKSAQSVLQSAHNLRNIQVPGPMVRVNGWLTESGTLFFLGLILIVTGAVLARKAQTAALVTPSKKKAGVHLDVPTLALKLAELSTAVKALSDDARAIDSPTVGDAEKIKSRIETLHLSHFEPIVESRYRLQASIGLGAFADVFSPFSSGERNLSRAWATLVDEHWPETLSALGRSAMALKRADESLQDALKSSDHH